MSEPIQDIVLWPLSFNCVICGAETCSNRFVWRFEDLVLPDDTDHERGGGDVCFDCYDAAVLVTNDFTTLATFAQVRQAKPEASE